MKWIMFKDVPAYIYKKLKIVVTRRSIYYWARRGRLPKGVRRYDEYGTLPVKLEWKYIGTLKVTSDEWVDNFLRDTN